MTAEIDPRLLEQIEKAGDDDEVQAVILVNPSAEPGKLAPGARGPGEELVKRVSEKVEEEPKSVRYMARLGVVVVRGSARLVRQLVQDPDVISATVDDADITALDH